MQAAVVGAFMIVDSFGHYPAQTVRDHGPPAARHEYPVALCRSMHKHSQRAAPAGIEFLWSTTEQIGSVGAFAADGVLRRPASRAWQGRAPEVPGS